MVTEGGTVLRCRNLRSGGVPLDEVASLVSIRARCQEIQPDLNDTQEVLGIECRESSGTEALEISLCTCKIQMIADVRKGWSISFGHERVQIGQGLECCWRLLGVPEVVGRDADDGFEVRGWG